MNTNYSELIVEISDLKNGETFPIKYTHRGEEISPGFILKNLSAKGKTIAIIFDDLQAMNHWIIWDIPAMNIIPENFSKDMLLQNSGNAKQRNIYRGPNPPKGISHTYHICFRLRIENKKYVNKTTSKSNGRTCNSIWIYKWIF